MADICFGLACTSRTNNHGKNTDIQKQNTWCWSGYLQSLINLRPLWT